MPFRALRASKAFTIFVVCVGVFSDVLLQNLVVPVLPYALKERVGLADEADVQWWNSLLLASFGGAFMLGSRTCGLDRSVHSLLLLTLSVALCVIFPDGYFSLVSFPPLPFSLMSFWHDCSSPSFLPFALCPPIPFSALLSASMYFGS